MEQASGATAARVGLFAPLLSNGRVQYCQVPCSCVLVWFGDVWCRQGQVRYCTVVVLRCEVMLGMAKVEPGMVA